MRLLQSELQQRSVKAVFVSSATGESVSTPPDPELRSTHPMRPLRVPHCRRRSRALAERRMAQYREEMARSARLAEEARAAAAEAQRKRREAIQEHDRACAELMAAERAIEEAAQREEHRQVSEALACEAYRAGYWLKFYYR